MLLLWKLTLAIWTWDDTAACAEVSIVCINVLFVQTLTDMTTFANAMWQCVGWELCFPWPPHSGELGRWRWANIWNTLRLLLPSRITSCRSWHHPTALQKATLLLRQKAAEIGDATAILAYPWDTSGWSRGAVCSQPWHVIRRPLPSFGLGSKLLGSSVPHLLKPPKSTCSSLPSC